MNRQREITIHFLQNLISDWDKFSANEKIEILNNHDFFCCIARNPKVYEKFSVLKETQNFFFCSNLIVELKQKLLLKFLHDKNHNIRYLTLKMLHSQTFSFNNENLNPEITQCIESLPEPYKYYELELENFNGKPEEFWKLEACARIAAIKGCVNFGMSGADMFLLVFAGDHTAQIKEIFTFGKNLVETKVLNWSEVGDVLNEFIYRYLEEIYSRYEKDHFLSVDEWNLVPKFEFKLFFNLLANLPLKVCGNFIRAIKFPPSYEPENELFDALPLEVQEVLLERPDIKFIEIRKSIIINKDKPKSLRIVAASYKSFLDMYDIKKYLLPENLFCEGELEEKDLQNIQFFLEMVDSSHGLSPDCYYLAEDLHEYYQDALNKHKHEDIEDIEDLLRSQDHLHKGQTLELDYAHGNPEIIARAVHNVRLYILSKMAFDKQNDEEFLKSNNINLFLPSRDMRGKTFWQLLQTCRGNHSYKKRLIEEGSIDEHIRYYHLCKITDRYISDELILKDKKLPSYQVELMIAQKKLSDAILELNQDIVELKEQKLVSLQEEYMTTQKQLGNNILILNENILAVHSKYESLNIKAIIFILLLCILIFLR